MQTLPERVLAYVRQHQLLKAGDRLGVAVSGGADSVALLRLLLQLRKELGTGLSVVHFNHQLRGPESDADEAFVASLAKRHKLQLHCDRGDVAAYSAERHVSLESAARTLRYEYFRRLLQDGVANRIATGHTLDDQAETVLLRVVRGAGTRGLAGIYPRLPVAGSRFPDASIVRPLLEVRRKDLETYLGEVKQDWREDSSNRDLRHARNRVRHGILPRLERNLNPAVREALAEAAEIARAEEQYWDAEVGRVERGESGIACTDLIALPLALRRRVVRAKAEAVGLRLEFRHVEEVLAVAAGSAKAAMLPRGWAVTVEGGKLGFQPPRAKESLNGYEYRLPVPGRANITEAGCCLQAMLVPGIEAGGYNPEQLLARASLASELAVRNWRAGDRFWPAHTKGPKKIKELLQEKAIHGAEKKLWPVVLSGSEIVWMRGFAVPERFRARAEEAVLIREVQ